MTWTPPAHHPPREAIDESVLSDLREHVSTATAVGHLHQMGLNRMTITGPTSRMSGRKVVGRAVTLQFMPRRDDQIAHLVEEYGEKKTALWHVLDTVEPDDVLVVQAFGHTHTGVIGEMLVNYFMRRGGIGMVIDGCIRDSKLIDELGLPVWACGTTPNFASQTDLFPWDFDVPIVCGGVMVVPGDVVMADDDGIVVVPASHAAEIAKESTSHERWEVFSRERIDAGGSLQRYYPLSDEAQPEYEAWRRERGLHVSDST